MARPSKDNLDYFPHDCQTCDKIDYLEAITGLAGYAIYFKLLEKIYRSQDGYYMKWDKISLALFAKRINVEKTLVNEVLTTAVEVNLFSKSHLEHGYLTSSGIQSRYLEAKKKKAKVKMHVDLLLANPKNYSNITTFGVLGELIPVNEELTLFDSKSNPQSKVKESKVKESTFLEEKVFSEKTPLEAEPPPEEL